MDFGREWILDGATGTELMKRGFDGRGLSEFWILEHPEVMEGLQKEYMEAGSGVLYTPTFNLNRAKLEKIGKGEMVRELNLRLAEVSLRAAGGKALVAGDIAPTGTFVRPAGKVTDKLTGIYLEQASALEEAGVDLFVIETMMTLSDLRSALSAVRSFSDRTVLVSCSVDGNGRMMDGTDALTAMKAAEEAGASAFGLNCSMGPAQMKIQLERLVPEAKLPLLAKPNAGLPRNVDGQNVYDCTVEEFAACMKQIREMGVSLLGGCCGTGPEHIRAIAR